jgi:2-oxoglutarate ferredoxin oxidoreductase subunit delta
MAEEKQRKAPPNIDIFKAWCKACGICAHFCPTGVLGRDEAGYPFVKDLAKCINCGWCEIRCPDFAITVTQGKEPKRTRKVEEEGQKGEAASG